MPTKTTKRKKTSPQMFNMGVFAIILVVTLILTVSFNGIITFLKGVEEQPDQAVTGDTGGREYKTYHLNNTMSGPLSFCSEAQPWSEGEVDGVFSTLVPLYSYCQGEDAPFQIANMQLYGKGEGVYALTQLALGVRGMFPHITPVVTGAYLPYAEAREGAGTSPFHTGYAFTLSFEGVQTHEETALSLWLSTYAHTYGFCFLDGMLLYVTPPHAYAMVLEGVGPTNYLEFLSLYREGNPYVVDTKGGSYALYYLPASHGAATLTLPRDTPFFVSGDGKNGFFVAYKV